MVQKANVGGIFPRKTQKTRTGRHKDFFFVHFVLFVVTNQGIFPFGVEWDTAGFGRFRDLSISLEFVFQETLDCNIDN